ncbi:MAG: hypothetical protein AAFX93_07465 [Verrucomicrobiota bacterium]
MKPAAFHHLQTRLYLHAVFPAFDGVIKASQEARALLKEQPFSVCFKTRSGLRASYHFTETGCDYIPGDSNQAELELFFFSDSHAAATFLEQTVFPPLPLRGFGSIRKMDTFKALSEMLKVWLKPTEGRLAEESFREVYVPLALRLALRGVCQLCSHDRSSTQLFSSGPHGLAVFQVGDNGSPVWIRFQPGELETGEGEPDSEPDARVIFRDSMVAALATMDKVDSVAAVGLGQIEVIGQVPLADHLNFLMERVQPFVDPEVAA